MSKSMYKDCEIGSIPTNWNIQKLEELANVTGGKRLPKGSSLSEINNGHPYIRVSDMNDKGIQLDSMLYVPDDVVEQISRYRVDKDDLYISVAGTLGLVGKVPDELNGANLTENADRISNIRCNTDFLLYCLKSDFIKKIINSEMTTNAQPKLALTRIKQFPIPVPPLKEQQKIAEILSSVDAAIEKTEQVIAKTEEVKKGLMQQLLTKGIGHTKFKQTDIGNIPIKWKLLTLESLCERVTRKNKSLNDNVLTISAQHGLINQAEFFNKIVAGKNIESYYLLKQGEFAYNKSYSKGYPFGVIRRLDRYEEGILSTLYICFKLKDEQTVTSDFINNIFESGLLDSQFVGIAKEGARAHGLLNIKVADFFNIQIPIPSLEEQNKISEVIKVMNIRIDSEEIKLKKLNEVKKGLMQQLLTGKTRVKID